MPVKTKDLYFLVITASFGEPTLRLIIEMSPSHLVAKNEQKDYTDGDVEAVEAGYHEKH